MTLIRPSKQEWLSAFVILPFLALTLNYIMFDDRLLNNSDLEKYSVPVVLIIAVASWYCRTVIMHWLRLRFPKFSQTKTRLALLAFTHVALVSLSICMIFYGYGLLHLFNYTFRIQDFNKVILLTFTITALSTTFWEADYTLKE